MHKICIIINRILAYHISNYNIKLGGINDFRDICGVESTKTIFLFEQGRLPLNRTVS